MCELEGSGRCVFHIRHVYIYMELDAFFYVHIIICIALMVIHVKSHSFEHYDLDS